MWGTFVSRVSVSMRAARNRVLGLACKTWTCDSDACLIGVVDAHGVCDENMSLIPRVDCRPFVSASAGPDDGAVPLFGSDKLRLAALHSSETIPQGKDPGGTCYRS